MENSYIDIETDLSLDQVVTRLQTITVDLNNDRQTQYHQVFKGRVSKNGGRVIDIDAAPKNQIVYDLKFILSGDTTTLRVSNNIFDGRQISNGLLKGLAIPFGFILLFLSVFSYENVEALTSMILISGALIIPAIYYKPKPPTHTEHLSDPNIQTIIKTVNGKVNS